MTTVIVVGRVAVTEPTPAMLPPGMMVLPPSKDTCYVTRKGAINKDGVCGMLHGQLAI
jgi:hypothetical protein